MGYGEPDSDLETLDRHWRAQPQRRRQRWQRETPVRRDEDTGKTAGQVLLGDPFAR